MQGTNPTASASTATPQLDSESKPAWAQISFDDGFDLNLGSTSALAAAPQKAIDSTASSTANTSRLLGKYT